MEKTLTNIVYDTTYHVAQEPTIVPLSAAIGTATVSAPVPVVPKKKPAKGLLDFFDNLFKDIFPSFSSTPTAGGKSKVAPIVENEQIKDKDLREQVKYLLELPDDQYDDKKLTSKLRNYISETEKQYTTLVSDYKSHMSPSYREFTPTHYNISGLFGKAYYAQSYPSYIDALWTRDILGFHAKWDMSWFIYPEDDSAIQSMLKNRVTQLRSEINDAQAK